MFKSKWRKKYEQAMENVEFWRKFHEDSIELFANDPRMVQLHTVQKMALGDILRDMQKIAESK